MQSVAMEAQEVFQNCFKVMLYPPDMRQGGVGSALKDSANDRRLGDGVSVMVLSMPARHNFRRLCNVRMNDR